jgi:hypothetical protein
MAPESPSSLKLAVQAASTVATDAVNGQGEDLEASARLHQHRLDSKIKYAANAITGIGLNFGSASQSSVTVVPVLYPVTYASDGSPIYAFNYQTPSSACSLSSSQCQQIPANAFGVTGGSQLSFPTTSTINLSCGGGACSSGSAQQCSATSCDTCVNAAMVRGYDTPVTRYYSLGSDPLQTFKFYYQTYTIPDQIKVFNEGKLIFDTGCFGTTGTAVVKLVDKTSTAIRVDVLPNCACASSPVYCSGTAWNFKVFCPDFVGVKVDGQAVQSGDTVRITTDARMPSILAYSGSYSVSWTFGFTYQGTKASVNQIFSDSVSGTSTSSTPYDLTAALGSRVLGGNLKVTWTDPDTGSPKVLTVKVLGQNPGYATLQSYVSSKYGGAVPWYVFPFIEQESSNIQFLANGLPLQSFDNGFGLTQLTNPPPSYTQLFSWKANIDGGIQKLKQTMANGNTFMNAALPKGQRAQAVRDTGDAVPVPTRVEGKCTFSDGGSKTFEEAIGLKQYNGAPNGNYCSWDNANKVWKFSVTDNKGKNYVNAVCSHLT